MVTKVAHIADLHFRSKNLEDINKSWEYVCNYLVENNINYLVIAGDVFDTYNISDKSGTVADIVSKVNNGLIKLSRAGVKVLIVEGNHDQAYGEHLGAIELLKYLEDEYNNIIVVSREWKGFNFEDVSFLCFPWYENRQELLEEIDNIVSKKPFDPGKPLFFVGHVFVQGSTNAHGIEISDNVYLSAAELDKLNADVYCVGHIHKAQNFDINGKKIYYSGPICQLNFGEENIEPTMNIYEVDPLENKILNTEFIPIEGKRYKNIIVESIKELKEVVENHSDDSYYKIKTQFDLSQHKEDDVYLEATSDSDITLVAQKVEVVEREETIEMEDYSPQHLLEQWCESKEIKDVPHEELKECIKVI